tara:strand:- start:188 stop:415 length:228 start_codon:yes stop_codon:yes gene_type:complete
MIAQMLTLTTKHTPQELENMMTRADSLLAQIRLCQTMLNDLPHLFAESTRGDITDELDRLISEHLIEVGNRARGF